jgi:Fur family transcriptional regulator, ferric uptake regulator
MTQKRKATRQRTEIVAALDRAEGFRTAQELHDELRSEGRAVGLTTVYRNLQALADEGEIDVLSSTDGEAMYRRCAADDHHHHLICRSCKRSIEVEAHEVERWAEQLAARHGYTSVTHTAEVFGVCDRCAR